jgi:ATP-binding cassette subfamily B multidrug efflux pump
LQAVAQQRRGAKKGNPSSLRRAIRYLGKQRGTVTLAYAALVIATIAQLAVPNLVQN